MVCSDLLHRSRVPVPRGVPARYRKRLKIEGEDRRQVSKFGEIVRRSFCSASGRQMFRFHAFSAGGTEILEFRYTTGYPPGSRKRLKIEGEDRRQVPKFGEIVRRSFCSASGRQTFRFHAFQRGVQEYSSSGTRRGTRPESEDFPFLGRVHYTPFVHYGGRPARKVLSNRDLMKAFMVGSTLAAACMVVGTPTDKHSVPQAVR